MVRSYNVSMKVEQLNEVEGPICSFSTVLPLLQWIVRQNNATEDYFSLSYKTIKQTKDRTKKSKIKMKVRSNELIL